MNSDLGRSGLRVHGGVNFDHPALEDRARVAVDPKRDRLPRAQLSELRGRNGALQLEPPVVDDREDRCRRFHVGAGVHELPFDDAPDRRQDGRVTEFLPRDLQCRPRLRQLRLGQQHLRLPVALRHLCHLQVLFGHAPRLDQALRPIQFDLVVRRHYAGLGQRRFRHLHGGFRLANRELIVLLVQPGHRFARNHRVALLLGKLHNVADRLGFHVHSSV